MRCRLSDGPGIGENVKLNVSGGNVVLKNLKLKTDALRDLELPLKIKEGYPSELSPLSFFFVVS